MGGHAAGEVASQAVCTAMSDYILSHPEEDGRFDETVFAKALEHAYAALDAKDTDDEKKMGTTLAFAMFHPGGCFVAHIGDSRIYHIRPSGKQVLFVTKDHSLVNELIALGEMTPEEAKTSRQKNVITRAIQPHQDGPARADWVNLTDLKEGDYIYLCSDGMLEQMEDKELVEKLSSRRPDPEKVILLKEVTKDNRDNHSAWLIRIVSTKAGKEEGERQGFLHFILKTLHFVE
jgi:protein phosphatase